MMIGKNNVIQPEHRKHHKQWNWDPLKHRSVLTYRYTTWCPVRSAHMWKMNEDLVWIHLDEENHGQVQSKACVSNYNRSNESFRAVPFLISKENRKLPELYDSLNSKPWNFLLLNIENRTFLASRLYLFRFTPYHILHKTTHNVQCTARIHVHVYTYVHICMQMCVRAMVYMHARCSLLCVCVFALCYVTQARYLCVLYRNLSCDFRRA